MIKHVQRTVWVALDVDAGDADAALRATMVAFNEAANWIFSACLAEEFRMPYEAGQQVYWETK